MRLHIHFYICHVKWINCGVGFQILAPPTSIFVQLLRDTKAFTTSRGPFVFPSVFLCVFCFFLICFPKSCQATCVTRGSEKSESSKPIGTRSLIYFWSTLLFSLNFRHTRKKKTARGREPIVGLKGSGSHFRPPCFPVLPCQSESHCSEEREAGRRAAREVSNCGPGSRPATQPLSLSNHLRLVLISGSSCFVFQTSTLCCILIHLFSLFWRKGVCRDENMMLGVPQSLAIYFHFN